MLGARQILVHFTEALQTRPEFKIWHHLSRLTISSFSSKCKCHNKCSCLPWELVEKLWANTLGKGKHFSHAFQLFFKCLSHGKFRIHKEFSGFENSVDYEHLRTWRYTSSLLLNPCSFILLLFQLWFVLLIMNGWPFSVCFFSCVQSMCCFPSGDWNFYYYHPMINLFPGW